MILKIGHSHKHEIFPFFFQLKQNEQQKVGIIINLYNITHVLRKQKMDVIAVVLFVSLFFQLIILLSQQQKKKKKGLLS